MKLLSRLRRLGAAAPALALLVGLAGCATKSLDPADKAVLVTAADLEPFGAPLPADFPTFERSSKMELMGTVEVEYEFDARAADGPYPYLFSTINRETTVSAAVAAYGAVKAGLSLADIGARDDSERFRYGDWSYFGTLLADDRPHGFVFYMRDDLTVYLLMVSGMYMDVDTMWQQLLLPRLEMLTQSQLSSR